MKVIVEFNTNNENCNDRFDLQLFQNASKMYFALQNMSNYLRALRKGHKEDDRNEIMSRLEEFVFDSGILEFE